MHRCGGGHGEMDEDMSCEKVCPWHGGCDVGKELRSLGTAQRVEKSEAAGAKQGGSGSGRQQDGAERGMAGEQWGQR